MKIKRLFSGIGLGLFAFAAVGAGLVGAKAKKAEPAVAGAPNTWMFRAQLNLSECSPNYASCVFPEDKPVDGVKFHYWGDNVDKTVDAYYMFFSTFDRYGVNVSLNDDQNIKGAQWIIHQKDEGYKYSVDIGKFGSDDVTVLDKTSVVDFRIIEWQYKHDWTSDYPAKWKIMNEYGSSASYIKFEFNDNELAHATDFTLDPVHNRFIIENIVYDSTSKWVGLANNGVTLWEGSKKLLDDSSKDLATGGSDSWFYLTETGTFDFILASDHLMIKKHEDTDTVYIYYVLENNTPTNDYIYSWGGNEQFGAWPGTKVREVDGVQEVTGNGVLHFQGSETPKLIYRIPVKKGYPVGDYQFKFNNNDTMETAARPINYNNAYWWDGDANGLAGSAIKFLVETEAIRNSASDTSVCNISKEAATSIVYSYMSLGASMQETYIDCTTVWTHKRDGSSGNELVSYRLVIEQLAKIADLEAELGISSSPELFAVDSNNSNLVLIISLVALVSVSSLSLLVVLKKRKHN